MFGCVQEGLGLGDQRVGQRWRGPKMPGLPSVLLAAVGLVFAGMTSRVVRLVRTVAKGARRGSNVDIGVRIRVVVRVDIRILLSEFLQQS